ncbi:mitochondrial carrier [Polychaeton citri CBS 116435]|uniref:Mitochondrial carrier n=1 Tax=Polychaeton citri CBS 116435 TaxID=1314669 RepID=A0A9P4UUQ2_9PEZI|nr:mitochondrial carrier [Polychaeton citri CBS 116435]
MDPDDEPNGFEVYNSQLDAFELYHAVQEARLARRTQFGIGPALPALGHATAGSIATATTKLLLYPLDLVITRMQVQRQLRGKKEAPSAASEAAAEYKSLTDAARKIYENEGGLTAFYTGSSSDVAKSFVDAFIFFLAYTFLRQRQLRKDFGDAASSSGERQRQQLSVPKELLIGMVAGATSRFFTTPIQNIVTRQQTAALVAVRDPNATEPAKSDCLSVKDIALQIRDERGLLGFWAGYSANILLTVNPAITFAMHSLLLRLLIPRSKRDKPGAYVTFLLAAVSKVVATATTYPVSLAKSRAQISSSSNGGKFKTAKDGKADTTSLRSQKMRLTALVRTLSSIFQSQYRILLSLRKVYQSEGLPGLYAGLEAEMLKGFLSHGLTMVMKESVHVGVIQTYYILLKLTK